MSKTLAIPLLSLAALIALAPSDVAAQGFDLQPDPTPSPSPAYGPQDPDRPAVRPIPVPTQSASPAPRTTPTPQPSADATPVPARQGSVVQSLPTAQPSAAARSQPAPRRPQTTAQQAPARTPSTQPATDTPVAATTALPSAPATTATNTPAPAVEELTEESGLPWLWIVLGVIAVALAGAFAWWRRREGPAGVSVPEIERPIPVKRAPSTPATGTAHNSAHESTRPSAPVATIADPAKVAPIPTPAKPAAVAFDNGPLHVAFEVRDITATLMAVTLNYRITLSNRGDAALAKILVGGALEAARADLAIERQLDPPQGQLSVAHQLESLEPGAVAELTGDIRVPLAQLDPIRRGEQVLFVPIARLRAAATPAAAEPVVAQQSVLLGRSDQGSELVPIRLDQGPRVYRDIGQRIVAPQAA